jgi:acetoin utilization deacetylase AcuC-like enzyme
MHISRIYHSAIANTSSNILFPDYHNIGRGAGLGYNVNVPMNKIKMGNSDYLAIWHQLLLPIAYEVCIISYNCRQP